MAASTDPPSETFLPISVGDGTTDRDDGGEEQEQTPPPPPPPSPEEVCSAITAVILVVVGCVWIYRHLPSFRGAFGPATYSVAIAAVSGLDPETDLQRVRPPPLLLNPAFNLTLRAALPGTRWGPDCVEAGTAVEVSYLRTHVLLASGPAPDFCVQPGEHREEDSVVAWGSGVRLPGFVVDSLAADLRRGTAEFGVRLVAPTPYCGGGSTDHCPDIDRVISCWAKIGAPPARCNVSSEQARFPVPTPGQGDSGYLPQPKH